MNYKNTNDEEVVEAARTGIHKESYAAQAEMMRRLKNSIEKLDKSTTKYSKILILLTLVLLAVALAHLITSIFLSDISSLDKFTTEVIALGTIFFLILYILREKSLK